MKSIQNKMLLVVISGLLVITAVVSAIAVSMTHEIMHKDADRILNNVCQKEAAYINDTLGDVVKSAVVMEHYATTEVGKLTDLHNEAYRTSYLEKAKRMFVDVALNMNGLEGFFMRINPEFSDGTTGFYNFITEGREFKEMNLTDLTKFAEDDTQNVGWYYTAVQARKGVWMEPYRFPGHEEQLISYVLPMYVNGELLGVVGFDMDFKYLVDRINTYEKIKEYTTYINALAYRDSLTGIKNSTAYTEAVKTLNNDINCNNPKFGVLVADINNLKQTNDQFGHDIGNELIIHTAKILTDIFKCSSIFRIGGDEFAIILKDTDYDSYRSLLERMDEACSKDFITVCENRIPVSIARGVSLFNSSIDRVYEDVFAKADHAMYMHKDQCKQKL